MSWILPSRQWRRCQHLLRKLKLKVPGQKGGACNEKEVKEVKERNKALEKQVIDLQSLTVKDNIVLFNINEDEKVNDDERTDTEAVLQIFIEDSMNVKTEIMLREFTE